MRNSLIALLVSVSFGLTLAPSTAHAGDTYACVALTGAAKAPLGTVRTGVGPKKLKKRYGLSGAGMSKRGWVCASQSQLQSIDPDQVLQLAEQALSLAAMAAPMLEDGGALAQGGQRSGAKGSKGPKKSKAGQASPGVKGSKGGAADSRAPSTSGGTKKK